MKRSSLLGLLLFLAAFSFFATAQTKGPSASRYLITGTVISSSGGSPVPHCRLTATLVPRGRMMGRRFPAPFGTFDADDQGHFSISLPSAGMWRLTASAHGYVTQAYDEHESFSSGIVLTPSASTFDLQFRISPEAVIAGRVLDEAGEPVRNARLSLLAVPPPGPDSVQPPASTRASVSTDDRGMYEFDELPPGDYRINVQAQVWYALAAQPRRFDAAAQSQLDPSLDVTYPLTWYPGTSDPAAAETITVKAGDNRQTDFQLLPVPSVHLRILPEAGATKEEQRIPAYPLIQRMSSGGAGGIVPVSFHVDPQGVVEVSGLAPGQYEIRLGGPGQAATPSVIQVTSGAAQTIDMSTAPNIASVSVHIDGISDEQVSSVQVNLIDPESGRVAGRSGRGTYVLSGALLHRGKESPAVNDVIEVPPGHYKVVLNGNPNLYLTGITAQSAQSAGRMVTVPSGSSTLVLHVAEGRATVTGVATFDGKPSIGAMVLLVPATLGDAAGVNIIRRDQTNTDGSFDLNDVLPGQYILAAIDHGWHINWQDPATLRNYIMHGIPLDLTSAASLKQKLEAQRP